MKRRRKPKPLTTRELNLLKYPPKHDTWECPRCEMVLAPSRTTCWLCHTNKPGKPSHNTWMQYQAAILRRNQLEKETAQ